VLLMTAYGIVIGGAQNNRLQSLVLQSTDYGVTWTVRSTIAAPTSDVNQYSETSMVYCGGNTWRAYMRTGTSIGPIATASSLDNALTWGAVGTWAPGAASDFVAPGTLRFPASGDVVVLGTDRNHGAVLAWRSQDGGVTFGAAFDVYRGAGGGSGSKVGYPSAFLVDANTMGVLTADARGWIIATGVKRAQLP